MSRVIVLSLLLTFTGALRAQPNAAMLYRIQNFRLDDFQIPPGGACEKVLLEASGLMGRRLTDSEIKASLDKIFSVTKETLTPAPPPPWRPPEERKDWRQLFCFLGDMHVYTPRGERWMEDLRPGDEVYSFDLTSRTLVVNTVAKVRATPGQAYGRLVDLPRQIDVTSRHWFLSGLGLTESDFTAIGDLAPEDQLYGVNTNDPCVERLTPVRRGRWVPQDNPATVHELTLVGEPRNYFVEGILVHNIKW